MFKKIIFANFAMHTIDMLYLFHDIEISVTRKAVRSLRLVVSSDGHVRLSAPLRTSDGEIMNFLERNAEWLMRTVKRVSQRQSSRAAAEYKTGELHLLWGKLLPLRVENERGRESVAFYDDEIVLYCHEDRDVKGRRKVIYQGYYMLFRPVLDEMVDKWCAKLGVTRPEITVRLMRTEWGSCTPRKNRMTFNVDMVRLPIDCMEYVVIHEFTHLDFPNHSPAFWALCDKRLKETGLLDSKTMRKRIRTIIRDS